MSKKILKPVSLNMPVDENFLPLAAAFVGQAARGFGLSGDTAEELALAAEETIAYITRINGSQGQDVTIDCRSGSHFVEADICLPVGELQLRAFNMTVTVDTDDEIGLDQMGLLIASRLADRFRVSRPPGGRLCLSLVKDRPYPGIDAGTPLKVPGPLSNVRLLEGPDAAQIKWFVRLVNQCYPQTLFPMDFRYPGKIVDMADAGDYRLRLLVGPGGEIGGGMAWRWEGARTVACFGPYSFGDTSDSDMAIGLVEACIADIARSPALVLINRTPTPQLPDGYFETLGSVDTPLADGTVLPLTAVFRLMHEDTGCVVWSHPDLEAFLQGEYRRLVFPREIQPVVAEGESDDAFSVLSVETDRQLGRATLRPIWPGRDCAANLAAHVVLLEKEGMADIRFEMDLGVAWHARFTPGLLQLGFRPRLLLPYAGVADRVIFQRGCDR
ncbi:MAG: hypothetical protein AB7U59_17475 [Desulfovibrionaceae bacterium]